MNRSQSFIWRDSQDYKKIQKNLRVIKERVQVDVDNFVDRAIEEDIFTFRTKEDIDHAPTPAKKADIFVMKILSIGQNAYSPFIKILHETGNTDVVDKMENSCSSGEPSPSYESRERTFVISRMVSGGEDGAAGDAIVQDHQSALMFAQLQRMVTSMVSTKTTEFQENLERQRASDKMEFQQKIEALSNKYETDYKQLQETYIGAKKQISEHIEKIRKLKLENELLKTERDTYKKGHEILEKEKEAITLEKHRLEMEVHALGKELAQTENVLSDLRANFEQHERNIRQHMEDEMTKKFRELSLNIGESLKDQQQEITALKASLKDITEDADDDDARAELLDPPFRAGHHQRDSLEPNLSLNVKPITQQRSKMTASSQPFLHAGSRTTTTTSHNKYARHAEVTPRRASNYYRQGKFQ